ncbi:MAG: substrate-binding domain-containing protein, partial [Candidatus Nanopelagicales bacterium]
KERESGTHVVFVDRPPALLDADYVVTDNVAGAREGVQHLISHGHRRIGYIGDLRTISTARERLEGYHAALAAAGIAVDTSIVMQDQRTSDDAEAAVAELLSRPDAPTAIFTAQNLVTIGALRALRRAGKHRTVAVVGFDELPVVDLIDPGPTLVVQDVVGLGGKAAELLFQRVLGLDAPPQHVVLPATLVVRGSGEIPGPYAT